MTKTAKTDNESTPLAAATTRKTAHRPLSMSLESWNSALQISSVILIGLTFVVGAATFLTGNLISKRKEERIATTESNVAEARIEAAVAALASASANERAADFERKAAEFEQSSEALRKDALVLEREVLTLREKLADRRLTPEQQQALAAELSEFSGQKAALYADPTDPEIVVISNEILAALGAGDGAGWVLQVVQLQDLSRSVRGILIEVSPDADEKSRRAGDRLLSALREQRMVVTLQSSTPRPFGVSRGPAPDPNTKLNITIGKKP